VVVGDGLVPWVVETRGGERGVIARNEPKPTEETRRDETRREKRPDEWNQFSRSAPLVSCF
jgi:hypothetical protein